MGRRTTAVVAGLAVAGAAALVGPALAEDGAEALLSPARQGASDTRDAAVATLGDGTLTDAEVADAAVRALDRGLDAGDGSGDLPAGAPSSWTGLAGDALAAAAVPLRTTADELAADLRREGATLASVARDRGVDVHEVGDALEAAAVQRVDEAAADGLVTPERARELRAAVGSDLAGVLVTPLG
jgi:hypothetical protein